MEEMLQHSGNTIHGKTCVISGSGNVALYCAQKITQLGGKVVTLSDSSGFIHDADGIDEEKLEYAIHLKTVRRGRISECAHKYGCDYYAGKKPWGIPCDVAFPCATENEIEKEDTEVLASNGCIAVAEGANMPTTIEAIKVLHNAKVLYAPGKASNAGGVAVSGLEMTQNSIRLSWSAEELQARLKNIMKHIHEQCIIYGDERGYIDYVRGANIAGFIKVADAMLAYGVI